MMVVALMSSAGIGASGWFAVFAYLGSGWLALRAFMAEKSGPPRPYGQSIAALIRVVRRHWPNVPQPARRAGLWLVIAALLLLLGLNRLLAVEEFVLDLWRSDARQQGSYGERRAMQGGFIAAAASVCIVAALALARMTRDDRAESRIALGGALGLLLFVTIRAASLHGVDAWLQQSMGGLRLGWLIELTALGTVATAAMVRAHRARAHRPWIPRRSRGAPSPTTSDGSAAISGETFDDRATITQLE